MRPHISRPAADTSKTSQFALGSRPNNESLGYAGTVPNGPRLLPKMAWQGITRFQVLFLVGGTVFVANYARSTSNEPRDYSRFAFPYAKGRVPHCRPFFFTKLGIGVH